MNMKTNTKYTVVCNVKENTLSDNMQLVHNYLDMFGSKNIVGIPKKTTGFIYGLFETVGDDSKNITIQVPPSPNEQGYIVLENLMYLEGDHTQNPPCYFEALKSVGQSVSDDGADEIVVSSVNENLFDVSQHIPNGWSNGIMLSNINYRSKWIKCKPNTTYFVESDKSGNRFGVFCSNTIKFGGEQFATTTGSVFGSSDDTDKIVSTTFTTDSTAKYLFVS